MIPKIIYSPLQPVLPVNLAEVEEKLNNHFPVKVLPMSEGVTGVYGYYKQGCIYLANEVPPGCEWHELFHAAFSYLKPSLKAKFLLESERLLGFSTVRLNQFEQLYASNNYNLSISDLRNKVLEDQLADAFEDYMAELEYQDAYLPNYNNLFARIIEREEESIVWFFFGKLVEGEYKDLPTRN